MSWEHRECEVIIPFLSLSSGLSDQLRNIGISQDPILGSLLFSYHTTCCLLFFLDDGTSLLSSLCHMSPCLLSMCPHALAVQYMEVFIFL